MKKRVHTKTNTITLALLGAGFLAGCSSHGAASGHSSGTPSSQASHVTASASAHASSSPTIPTSPGAMEQAALASLGNAKSVHADFTLITTSGTTTESMDSTQSGGRQVVTLDKVSHVTILDIKGVGYVQGDAPGLIALFGVSQTKAAEFAGQWIKVTSGEKLGQASYHGVIDGIALPSLAQNALPSTLPTAHAPAVIDGQHTVAIQQPAPASAKLPASARFVLYMTDTPQLLPVLSEVTGGGPAYKNTIAFSHWGEAVHLTAPAQTVPASDLTQSSSSA